MSSFSFSVVFLFLCLPIVSGIEVLCSTGEFSGKVFSVSLWNENEIWQRFQ